MKSYLHNRRSTVALAAAAIVTVGVNLLFGLTSHAQGTTTTTTTTTAEASVWDGVYTEAQAARGKTFYTETCAPCHGDEPVGSSMAPSLTGTDFVASFGDQTLFDLADRIVMTMPANNPGTVTPAQAADVMAFLGQSNKWPAGEKELPADLDALKKIKIVKK